MVIELTAGTYDWERLYQTGRTYVTALEKLATSVADTDHATAVDRTEDILTQTFDSDEVTRFDAANTDGVKFEVPARNTSWHSFALLVDLSEDEAPHARLTVDADIEDTERVLHDGPITEFDVDAATLTLEYVYHHTQEAYELENETYLSLREAQVFVLLREGYDSETILDLTGIPSQSNLTTYKQRIRDRQSEAQQQKTKAEATLETLSGTWVTADDTDTSD